MPLYDLSSFVAVRLAVSRYEGIVEGQGNPDVPLRMRFINKRARDEINYGDLIVSNGIGGVYPPGITVGRVSTVHYQEYEISMEVELEPVVDFSRLEYVFVIDPKITEPKITGPEETSEVEFSVYSGRQDASPRQGREGETNG
jgi:rod shape-determining protein MreC